MNEIDLYMEQFPPEVQVKLQELRRIIGQAAPLSTEKISYGMPTWYQNGNLVHFAGYKKHIGFYPSPDGITAFAGELKPYKTSKGAVRFPLDKPLPLELIARIVRFRASCQPAPIRID
jgi:uncharacterized protein YdhG (YjbR/CyaY superfamily)